MEQKNSLAEGAALPRKQLRKEDFIFEPLNIQFDENCNPVEKNADYLLLKEIFTDPEVMKTSTFFACGIPQTERDLHLIMISGIEAEEEYRKDYGFVKAFYKETGEYMAVGGLIRRKEYAKNKFFVEGLAFLKPKYIGSGIGFFLEKIYFDKAENLDAIFVASVWEQNIASVKLIEKNNMIYKGNFLKTYNNKSVTVSTYIKLPSNIIIPDELLNISQFFTCNAT